MSDQEQASDASIFDAITDDHDVQRTLIEQLVDTTGESDGRRDVFARLRAELVAHAGAEERFFYVPLMEHDMTQDQARHSVAEHKEIDDFLERLEGYDMSGPQWIQTAEQLEDRLLHHLAEEEREIFPVAGRVLGAAEKGELAAQYRSDMERRRAD